MLIIFRTTRPRWPPVLWLERTRLFDRLSHNHPILDISFNQAIAVTPRIVRINLHHIRGVPRDVHDHFDRLNTFSENWGDQLPWAPEGFFFSRERQDVSTDPKDLTKTGNQAWKSLWQPGTIIFFLIWKSGIVSEPIIKCTVGATYNRFYKVIPSMLLTWPPTQALWCLQPAVPTLKFPYVFQCTRYVNLLLPKKTKKALEAALIAHAYSNVFPFFLIKARNTLWTDFLSCEQLETRKLPAISQNYRFFSSCKRS